MIRIEAKGLAALPLGDSGTDCGSATSCSRSATRSASGQTVTMGIVSAKGRATGLGDGSFEDFLQTDAPINQGNSGGALVNTSGELVGINSQILSPSGGNIGIGFAIPADDGEQRHGAARRRTARCAAACSASPCRASAPTSRRASASPRCRARSSARCNDGSPAEAAGLERGDVITAFNGEPVADSNNLRNRVAGTLPGSTVTLRVVREGEAEDPHREARRAVRAEDGAERLGRARRGRARSASPSSPSRRSRRRSRASRVARAWSWSASTPRARPSAAGFRPGDVIQEVNGRPVADAAELKAAVKASGDRPALVLVDRDGGTLFLALERQA